MPALILAYPILSSVLFTALVTGLSYGLQAALQPNIRKPLQSARADNLRTIQRNPNAPLRIVYGQYRASGVLLFARSVNRAGVVQAGGSFLHAAIALAHGPVEDLFDIQLDSDPANSTKFSGLVAFVPFMGTTDQAMFRGPIVLGGPGFGSPAFPREGGSQQAVNCQLPTEWLAAYRPLRQVAYLWALLKNDPLVFPGGAPNIRVTIKGRLVFDPRDTGQRLDDPTTWRWSNNWALCVYDFLRSTEYGLGIADAEIDRDSIIAAANLSDEPIDAPSDTDPNALDILGQKVSDTGDIAQVARYTCDGLFETDEQPIDVLGKLLSAGAGSCLFYGGTWHVKGGAAEPVAVDTTTGLDIELTPDDLRDDASIQVTMLPGRQSRINTVRATFVNPVKQYVSDDVPPVQAPEFLQQDGNVELSQQLQLDFTQQLDRAQYIAGIFLREARMGRFIWPGKPTLTQIVPKSVIKVTHPWLGWSQKLFRVENRTRNPDGGIDLELAEYIDANYQQFDGGIGLGTNLPQPTDLPGPFQLAPPTNVQASEIVTTNPDGSRSATIRVTWDPPTDGLVDSYQVAWSSLTQPPQYLTVPGTTTSADIVGVAVGTYSVGVASRLNIQTSAYIVVQVTVTFITPPPPDPIDFRIVLLPNRPIRHLSWTVDGGTIPKDVRGFEVRWANGTQPATADAFTAATFITLTADTALDTSIPMQAANPGITTYPFTYFVRTLDIAGQYSTHVAALTVTLLPDDPDVLVQREFFEEGWPGMIVQGRIDADGHLAGVGGQAWEDWSNWETPISWSAGGTTLIYTTPTIDLISDRTFTVLYQVMLRANSSYRVEMQSRAAADTSWGPFRAVGESAFGALVRFRLIAYATGSAPVLEHFAVQILGVLTTEVVTDVTVVPGTPHAINLSDRIRRQEPRGNGSPASWLAGPWRVNIQPVPLAPPTNTSIVPFGCTIEPETSWALDGATTYATAGDDNAALQLQTLGWTVDFVVHFDTTASSDRGIIIGRYTDWQIEWDNGVVKLVINGTLAVQATISSIFPIHHIAFTGQGNLYNIYVDGVFIGELTGSPPTAPSIPVTASKVVILGADASAAHPFQGQLEEVRIWTAALDGSEIAAIAGVSVDPADSRLAVYWRMDDATGATIHDRRTGNISPINCTITGTPVWVRMAYREAPPIDLTLLPAFTEMRFNMAITPGTDSGADTVQVQASIDRTTWSTIATTGAPTFTETPRLIPGNAVPGWTPGNSYFGQLLYIRMFLTSTDPDSAPLVQNTALSLRFSSSVGDIVLQPQARSFATIEQASVQALVDTTRPITWSLCCKDPLGARFKFYDALSGDPVDTVSDIVFRGAELA